MTEPQDKPLSELYQRSRFETPPRKLDEAIRHQAHLAVSRRKPGWFSVPRLALAASLVLGIGIGLRVIDQAPPEHLPEAAVAPLQHAAPALAPAPAQAPAADALSAPPASFESVIIERESDRRAQARTAAPAKLQSALQSAEAQRHARRLAALQRVCGDKVPTQADDPAQWRARIAYLNGVNEHALARCLQELYQQRFPEDAPSE